MSAEEEKKPEIELLVLPGSQFVMKAMAALQYLGLPYKVRRVSPTKMKKELPPPHQVPVMVYNGEVVPDSHDILVYLNERHGPAAGGKNLFDQARVTGQFATAEELETWSGDVLYVWSLYYSWVDDEAWERSLRPALARAIPGFLQKFLPCLFSADKVGSPIRQKQEKRCREVLGDEALATSETATQGVVEALNRLEASLETEEQRYLQGTDGPTAADFAVYGNLLRMVDTSFDAKIGAGYPGLLETAKTARLAAWLARMKEEFPLQFYNRSKMAAAQE